MNLTVKQLKEKIKDLPDDTDVFIERVEDIYFDKHGWETERLVFQIGDSGEPIDYTDVFNSSQCFTYEDKLIIGAHY